MFRLRSLTSLFVVSLSCAASASIEEVGWRGWQRAERSSVIAFRWRSVGPCTSTSCFKDVQLHNLSDGTLDVAYAIYLSAARGEIVTRGERVLGPGAIVSFALLDGREIRRLVIQSAIP